MAVLVEALSVVIRRDSIDRNFEGGWMSFLSCVPNRTMCSDGVLVRVGFMTPGGIEAFRDRLVHAGLTFLLNGKPKDFAFVDQQQGLITPCEWLEFARIPIGDEGGRVGACWLYERPKRGWGIHLSKATLDLATPSGWKYEESLSKHFSFVPNANVNARLKYLRVEDGLNVFLDTKTGREVFKARETP